MGIYGGSDGTGKAVAEPQATASSASCIKSKYTSYSQSLIFGHFRGEKSTRLEGKFIFGSRRLGESLNLSFVVSA